MSRRSDSRTVAVVGRFPPPTDGQTMATERCASFLETAFGVLRVDTQPPGPDPLSTDARFDVRRTLHYLALRRRMARALSQAPAAPVIWQAVSPAPLGHLRDVWTSLPTFGPSRPVVAVVHRAGFEALTGSRWTAASTRRLVQRVDAFVFLSPALAERCADVIPEAKRRVIPNTVRDDLIPDIGRVLARPGPMGPLHVLFLSNMMPEKGYGLVLEAVDLLHAGGHSVRATFVGRWPAASARAAFEARVQVLGLADVVAVLGGVADPAEVARLHLSADVLALPTTHPTESQPVTILEALASGTPVVAVNRPVMRDLITHGVEGALVPPHDPNALAEALTLLAIPDVWRTTSKAARARFDAAFHPAVVAEQWRALAREFV